MLQRLSETGAFSAVFHAMAVMDFAPSEARPEKRASGAPWTIELHPTPKMIDRFGVWFPNACLVGFKLESGITEAELVSRAARLARRCGADIVVANLLEWVETGYRCLVVDRDGIVRAEVAGREATAAWLWRHVEVHRPVPVPATGSHDMIGGN
jgi:phosphopantothenoylcysteine decarboxylase/phosphopantothenate--cysteine ligase